MRTGPSGIGLEPLPKRPQTPPGPFHHVRAWQRDSYLWDRNQSSPDTKSTSSHILDFPDPKLREINVVYKPPSIWYFSYNSLKRLKELWTLKWRNGEFSAAIIGSLTMRRGHWKTAAGTGRAHQGIRWWWKPHPLDEIKDMLVTASVRRNPKEHTAQVSGYPCRHPEGALQ